MTPSTSLAVVFEVANQVCACVNWWGVEGWREGRRRGEGDREEREIGKEGEIGREGRWEGGR